MAPLNGWVGSPFGPVSPLGIDKPTNPPLFVHEVANWLAMATLRVLGALSVVQSNHSVGPEMAPKEYQQDKY